MKKSILIAAIAALALSFTACQKDNLSNGEEINPRVKSTSDLQNTEWTYTVTTAEFLTNLLGADFTDVDYFESDTMSFGLNFDSTYAHFSFPDNTVALVFDDDDIQQIYGVSYTYSYDGTTHTGYLIGEAEDDNGNVVPAQLQFTYDDATDAISMVLPLYVDDATNPINYTVVFYRNE